MAYTILLIDDSSIVRKMLRKTLGLTGLALNNIHEAANGKEALDVLGEQWVDLVFLDINMPIMNGMEFMERIRSEDVHKALPVIVVSTEGSLERKSRLTELGVSRYLRKPVTPEQLTEAVTEVLGSEEGA